MRIYEFWDIQKRPRHRPIRLLIGRVIVEDGDELWPIRRSKGWPLFPLRVRPAEKEAAMANALLIIQKDTIISNLATCIDLLGKCQNVEDVKKAVDLGVAAKVWAERQKLGTEAQNSASEFVLHATRRLGVILRDTDKHQGGRPGKKPVEAKRQVFKLSELGISRDLSSQAQQLAAVPDEQFAKAIADEKRNKREISYARIVRELKRQANSDNKRQQAVVQIGDATVMDSRPTPVFDPDTIISRIYAFIDEQLLSTKDEARVKVAQALHEYASKITEQTITPVEGKCRWAGDDVSAESAAAVADLVDDESVMPHRQKRRSRYPAQLSE